MRPLEPLLAYAYPRTRQAHQQTVEPALYSVLLRKIHRPLYLLWLLCCLSLLAYYFLDLSQISEREENKYILNRFFQGFFLLVPIFFASITLRKYIYFSMSPFFWFLIVTAIHSYRNTCMGAAGNWAPTLLTSIRVVFKAACLNLQEDLVETLF